MKTLLLTLGIFLLIIIQGCKKDTAQTPDNPGTTTDSTVVVRDSTISHKDSVDVPSKLFIAGTELSDTSFRLLYWNNAKTLIIDSQHFARGPGVPKSTPTSIFVSGKDIYIGGSSLDADGFPRGTLWKNGVQSYITDKLQSGNVSSIFVENSDLYIAGKQSTKTNNLVAYWKNGVPVPLIDGPIAGDANSIVVAGNDVYVAGYERIHQSQTYSSAVYWKNGERTVLSNDSLEYGIATSVFVFGNDVYIAGDIYTNRTAAVFWKNGVRTVLPGDDVYDQHAVAIGVIGNDVYVAGYGNYKAKYWKNGTLINLTDGKEEAFLTGLSISNGDIYFSGYENGLAIYWKNGVSHPIKYNPWDSSRRALAIFAAP